MSRGKFGITLSALLFCLLSLLFICPNITGQPQCPSVEVEGPSRKKATEIITYRAKVKNFPSTQRPQFNWTVEGAEIIAGQGTDKIRVRPHSRVVVAKVSIANTLGGCELTASKNTEVTGALPNSPPLLGAVSASISAIVRPCPPGTSSKTCNPTGNEIQLTVNASDPDNDELLYTWSVTGGRLIGEGRSVMWDLTGVAAGTYTVTVEVNDGNNNTESTSLAITVSECADCERPLPACPTLNVSPPADVRSGERATFTASITESPDASLTFYWSVSAGTIVSGQGTSSITVDTTGLAGQSITATVSVGGVDPSCSGSSSASMTVLSPPPETSLITGVVQDSNGRGIVGAQVTAVREGNSYSATTGADGRYTLRTLPTGTYTVTARVRDYVPSSKTVNLRDPGDQGEANLVLRRAQ